jgi:xylulokinase
VLGIPVKIPETREGTAIGTAILAAIGSGYYGSTDDAVSMMIRFRESVTPNEERHREYSKQYQIRLETRKHCSKR